MNIREDNRKKNQVGPRPSSPPPWYDGKGVAEQLCLGRDAGRPCRRERRLHDLRAAPAKRRTLLLEPAAGGAHGAGRRLVGDDGKRLDQALGEDAAGTVEVLAGAFGAAAAEAEERGGGGGAGEGE